MSSTSSILFTSFNTPFPSFLSSVILSILFSFICSFSSFLFSSSLITTIGGGGEGRRAKERGGATWDETEIPGREGYIGLIALLEEEKEDTEEGVVGWRGGGGCG